MNSAAKNFKNQGSEHVPENALDRHPDQLQGTDERRLHPPEVMEGNKVRRLEFPTRALDDRQTDPMPDDIRTSQPVTAHQDRRHK